MKQHAIGALSGFGDPRSAPECPGEYVECAEAVTGGGDRGCNLLELRNLASLYLWAVLRREVCGDITEPVQHISADARWPEATRGCTRSRAAGSRRLPGMRQPGLCARVGE